MLQLVKFSIISVLFLGVSACSTISNTFRHADLTAIDFQSSAAGANEYAATIKMTFKNPNTYAIQIGEVNYKLVINDDDVTTGKFDKSVTIQPNAEETITAKIKFKYTSDQQGQSNNLLVEPYILSGTASVGLHVVHFNHKGEFASSRK